MNLDHVVTVVPEDCVVPGAAAHHVVALGLAPPVTDATPLTFETGNHDEILAIVERIKGRGLFDDATATSFAVGLKLFTEVMLENRTHPLFDDLRPHLEDRPIAAWARTLVPHYAWHVGAVLPDDWLAPLRQVASLP